MVAFIFVRLFIAILSIATPHLYAHPSSTERNIPMNSARPTPFDRKVVDHTGHLEVESRCELCGCRSSGMVLTDIEAAEAAHAEGCRNGHTRLRTPFGRVLSRLLGSHSPMVTCAVAVALVGLATFATFPLTDTIVHSRSLILLCGIMLAAWYGGLWPGAAASILAVLSFDYFFDSHPGVIDLNRQAGIRLVLFLAGVSLIAYLTAQRRRALMQVVASRNELAKALREIRVLRGLLPICMYCKQIRNDAGLWQQIERYISEHSNARFTHGICPDCLRKLHPDAAEGMELRKSS